MVLDESERLILFIILIFITSYQCFNRMITGIYLSLNSQPASNESRPPPILCAPSITCVYQFNMIVFLAPFDFPTTFSTD